MADVQTAMTEMMDFIDNDKQMKCTAECNTENNNNKLNSKCVSN